MVELDTKINTSNSNNFENNIEPIYTTSSNERTYIAAGKNYLGDVNSYSDNFVLEFFAWLFRLSINVNFDGQNISVNKKSYLKLVNKLTEKDIKIKDIKNYTFFKNVANSRTVESFGLMRDHISSSDSNYLFGELAKAISSNNTNQACKLIGQGASLDQVYYDRGEYGVSFKSDNVGLDKKNYRFKVVKANPFLQAHVKNNTVIAKKLEEFGANTTNEGEEYTFNRVIKGVKHTTEIVKETKYKTHFPEDFTRNRAPTFVDREGHVIPEARVESHRNISQSVRISKTPVITKETTFKAVPRTTFDTGDFKTDACMIKLEY
ncbi:MAG: hypothetical protein VX777_04980 [Chlamydiota bacterium]|nr:hypothetical protein [Chlamydiota bacterium]